MLSTVVFASVAAIESLRSLVVLKPIEILSSQSNPKKPFLFIFLILIAIVLYLRDVQLSLILCGTLAVLLFLSWLIITVTLFVLRKIVPTIPIVWFTIRSIEYQGKIVMTALFLCTTLVLILAFMGHSLEYSLTQAYPADSPNMFIFDISPEYINGLTLALPNDTLFYPIIRGRLSAINGQAINEEAERNRAGDNLVREFSMTYFDAIPKNEEFVSGNSLFLAQVQNGVSVMDTVAERGSFGVGDTLTFTVGGIAFDAEVTSVRKRTTRTIEPFFYFVFSEQQLRDAPARFFAAIQSNDTSALTSTLALQYPGVGVVDIASLAKIAGKITSYLLLIVTGFMTLTFISCIVLFAALAYGFGLEKKQLVLSARIVGAFIRSYIILESILMSAIAGTLAVIVAAVSSHLLLSTVLGLSLEIPWGLTSTILIVSTTLLVVGALLTQQKLLSYKPIEVLKNDA
jgi:putative ABC transport system permease protein